MGAAHELMGLKDYVAKNNKLTWIPAEYTTSIFLLKNLATPPRAVALRPCAQVLT